jgi:hypothetical protein
VRSSFLYFGQKNKEDEKAKEEEKRTNFYKEQMLQIQSVIQGVKDYKE